MINIAEDVLAQDLPHVLDLAQDLPLALGLARHGQEMGHVRTIKPRQILRQTVRIRLTRRLSRLLDHGAIDRLQSVHLKSSLRLMST